MATLGLVVELSPANEQVPWLIETHERTATETKALTHWPGLFPLWAWWRGAPEQRPGPAGTGTQRPLDPPIWLQLRPSTPTSPPWSPLVCPYPQRPTLTLATCADRIVLGPRFPVSQLAETPRR